VIGNTGVLIYIVNYFKKLVIISMARKQNADILLM
jgi:hypothetical protein